VDTRRQFLARAGAVAAALAAGCRSGAGKGTAPNASTPTAGADRLGPLGVGLFTLPKSLEKDFDGTLAMLAGLGYKEVELFGPYPFSTDGAKAGWQQASQTLGFSGSGFFGRTARQVRESLDRAGLGSPSMHVELDTLRDRLDQVGEAAREIGWRYCGIASIPEDRRRTLDDYKRMADELNAIGQRAKPMGFKVLYHNHGYGLTPMDGQVPARVVFDRLDPSVVALEMDIFWTVAGGADPVELLDAYPRLYRLMHVKDMSRIGRFTRGGDMQDVMGLFPLMTTAGAGVLDLPRILGHAQKNGVEHFYVEQDLAADPPAQLGASIRYLRQVTLKA
jgi:sugar phosphate isomerase/epimerase